MARSKFVELIISPNGDSPNHSLAGYQIVSDYSGDKGRHLFLKRGESTAEPTKTKRARKSKPATPASQSQPQTSFDTDRMA